MSVNVPTPAVNVPDGTEILLFPLYSRASSSRLLVLDQTTRWEKRRWTASCFSSLHPASSSTGSRGRGNGLVGIETFPVLLKLP